MQTFFYLIAVAMIVLGVVIAISRQKYASAQGNPKIALAGGIMLLVAGVILLLVGRSV